MLRRRTLAVSPGLLPFVLAAGVLGAAPAAAQSLAGTWTNSERSMEVTIQSWGADCPAAPESYSSHPNTPVEVQVEGDQLIFPGGRRSDRCWSDNPALRRTRFSKQGNRFIVSCETPADDPRQEKGTYVVTADPERISIEITSDYDWSLRETHCQARLVERRVLVRTAPPAADAGTDAADTGRSAADVPAVRDTFTPPPPPPPVAPRRCETPGAPARLRLRAPRTVAPGGSGLVSAHQIDAQGCDLGPVTPTFEISGQALGCRVDADGTFRACQDVAKCDGETIRVRARVGELSGAADIRVTAEIEDGLGTVAPVWADDPEAPAATLAGGSQVSASLQGQTPPVEPGPAGAGGPAGTAPPKAAAAEEETSPLVLWAIIGGGALVMLAAVFWLVTSGRKRRRNSLDTIDDLAPLRGASPSGPGGYTPPVPAPPVAAVPVAPPEPAAPPVWHCPACRVESPEAGFCVHDGVALAQGKAGPPPREVLWVACPQCGRGFPRDSKFCPEDRELLRPYGMGMNDFKARQRGKAVPPMRRCSRCGTAHNAPARFCPKDGDRLP